MVAKLHVIATSHPCACVEAALGVKGLAYRRVATFIHLPALTSNSRTSQLIAIDHAELEAALQQDRDDVQ